MIGYAAPLMVVALSAIILGEIVRVYRWTATGDRLRRHRHHPVAAASPSSKASAWRMPRSSARCLRWSARSRSAFAAIFIRSMTRTESTGSIVIYFALSGIAAVAAVAAVRLGRAGRRTTRCFSSRSDCSAASGQILMTSAYRHAGAATIASFEYVSMLWGLTFGYLVLRRGADGERHRRRRDRHRRRHLHHLPRAPARPGADAPAQGDAAAARLKLRTP